MGKKENDKAGDNKLSCPTCDKQFRYESEKIRHELSHTTLYECKVCRKTFNFVSALKRHEKQHNRNGSVQCKECNRCFRDETLLKRHVKYSHKGSYTCAKCLAIFPSDQALRVHEKTHRPQSERRYRCSFEGCDKSFNFPHHLKHHELTHTDTKQHYCVVCGKGFIQLYHLKSHLKKHAPEEWLPCVVDGCKKLFPTDYALRRHTATHKLKIKEQNGTRVVEKSEDHVLCPSCGELVIAKKMAKHSNECTCRGNDHTPEPKDNSIVTLTEEDLNDETFVHNDKTKVLTNFENSDKLGYLNKTDKKHDDAINNCKTALGSCLATDMSNGACLCDQITSEEEMYNEQFEIMIGESTGTFPTANTPKGNKTISSQCEGCACSANCEDYNYPNTTEGSTTPSCSKFKDIAVPKIEYRSDGIIKLSETFDVNIELSNNANTMENDAKSNSDVIPFNSCRAVLGNCIVSGNDKIGEDCFCARMGLDAQQATAQEIDEISILSEVWPS